jgi:hypothetical protein
MTADWNRTCGLFGLPRQGKSTLSARIIREWQREGRALAFVFEGGGSFPQIRGWTRRHPTVEEARAHVARELRAGRDLRQEVQVVAGAGSWDPASDRGGGLEVARLAVEVAEATGGRAVVWFDEINNVDGACSGWSFSRWLRATIGNRRHLRLALGYSSQSPAWPHRNLRRLTNEVYALRVADPSDLELLREMGAPAADLPRIAALPPFHFIHYPRLG